MPRPKQKNQNQRKGKKGAQKKSKTSGIVLNPDQFLVQVTGGGKIKVNIAGLQQLRKSGKFKRVVRQG